MPFWAGMLTEDQHLHSELQQAIRQASWDLFFSRNAVCKPPAFVEGQGMDLASLLDGNLLLVWSRADSTSSSVRVGENTPPILPITLKPANSRDLLTDLLRTKEALIEVSYTDGRNEVRRWHAGHMKPSSSVLGNLRSRPELRQGAWQKNGITGLRVRIDCLRNPSG